MKNALIISASNFFRLYLSGSDLSIQRIYITQEPLRYTNELRISVKSMGEKANYKVSERACRARRALSQFTILSRLLFSVLFDWFDIRKHFLRFSIRKKRREGRLSVRMKLVTAQLSGSCIKVDFLPDQDQRHVWEE